MLTLMLSAEDPFLSAIINHYLMNSVARGDRRKIEGGCRLGDSPQQMGKEFAELLPERDLLAFTWPFTPISICVHI
jgi:hypothetical protein